MRTTLESTRLVVTPGQPVTLDIEVTNTASVIDGVSALVVGIDPTWVQLLVPVVSLFPDGNGRLVFRFELPLSCPAGDLPLVIRVFSTVDPDDVEEHDVCLAVEPVPAAELHLRPSLVNGGKSADMRAVVTNTGNVPAEFSIDAVEPTRALQCRAIPTTLRVPPGEERHVVVTATGRRPWFGNPVGRTITVTASSGPMELTESGRFNQKPRIARGVVTALILAGIIILWALIFLWVIGVLGKKDTAMKSVGAGFLGAPQPMAIENVSGRVTGRVTAVSTGDGQARITVEAYPVDRNGNAPTATVSTATTDDGTFILDSLLPGTYRFRFSANGYTEAFCTDAAGNRDLVVQPSAATGPKYDVVCNVAMEGIPADLTIAVTLPQGATTAATVTVQQLVPGLVPGDPGTPPPTTAVQVGPTTYVASGLATPAQYEVSIAVPGFRTQTAQVAIGAGQNTVLDPSALTATSGVISGVVRDSTSRKPLGGVTVTLRSGSLIRTVLTPTVSGSEGQYQFDGLDTPGTYVVTFTLQGYSSVTRSLELQAGGSSTGAAGDVFLDAGNGVVSGTVTTVNAAGATVTLGGVVVTVSNATFTANTSTLTGGTSNGSFTLSGLPTPGSYTVSFTSPGYQSEFVNVQYLAAGSQTLNVRMSTSVAQVSGTVLVNGAGAGGVRVALSDGTQEFATLSSDVPAGQFSLVDIPPGTYTLSVWVTYQVNGVVQPPASVQILRLTAGQRVSQTISVAGP